MKHFLFSIFLFASINTFSQDTCIVMPDQSTLCFGGQIMLNAYAYPDTVTYAFRWEKNGVLLPDSTRSVFVITNASFADTGVYRCIASFDTVSLISNPAYVDMYQKLNLDTLYRYNELGCPGTCKGQMKALVSGGTPPYYFNWGGGHSQDTIVFGLCQGYFTLTVRDYDTTYCISKKYYIDVLKLPKVSFTLDPPDTIYLTNPTLTASFPDTSEINLTNWKWIFSDDDAEIPNINPVQHIYSKTGRWGIALNITDLNGCDSTITDSILVKVAELKIPNVFTPNGDGSNDTFEIEVKGNPDLDYREVYISSEMIIFDRWGRKIYQAINYKSGDWDGGRLPDGVYFYILKCRGEYGTDVFKGSVTIIGRNFD